MPSYLDKLLGIGSVVSSDGSVLPFASSLKLHGARAAVDPVTLTNNILIEGYNSDTSFDYLVVSAAPFSTASLPTAANTGHTALFVENGVWPPKTAVYRDVLVLGSPTWVGVNPWPGIDPVTLGNYVPYGSRFSIRRGTYAGRSIEFPLKDLGTSYLFGAGAAPDPNSIVVATPRIFTGQTTNATPLTLGTVSFSTDSATSARLIVIGKRSGGSERYYRQAQIHFIRSSGVTSEMGTHLSDGSPGDRLFVFRDDAAHTSDYSFSFADFSISVTGKVGHTINWRAALTYSQEVLP